MTEEEKALLIEILNDLSGEIAGLCPDSCAPWPASGGINRLRALFEVATDADE